MQIAGRNTPYRDGGTAVLQMAASTKIFAGSIVMVNAAGFAVKGQTAAGLTYVGRAEATVDNLAGADGAKTISVRRHVAFKWANSSADPVTQASLFKSAYVVDDETVAKTSNSSARSAAGIVTGIDADGVWIE